MTTAVDLPQIEIERYVGSAALASDRTTYTVALMDLLNDVDAEPDEITELISADPNLVSRLLTLANSAWMGARHESTNVWDAARVLGFSMVRNIAAAGLVDLDPRNHHLPPGYIEHSIASAAGAAAVADLVGVKVRDAWSVALLHDLGVVLMAGVEPGLWNDAIDDEGCRSVASERALFGFGHDELANAVMEHLRLPALVCCAVAEHNRSPSTSANPISLTVRAGVAIAEASGVVSCSQPVGPVDSFLSELGLFGEETNLLNKLEEHTSNLTALLR